VKGGPSLPLALVCGRCLFLDNKLKPEKARQGHEAFKGQAVRVGFKLRKAVLADAEACRGGRLGQAQCLAPGGENLAGLVGCGQSGHGEVSRNSINAQYRIFR